MQDRSYYIRISPENVRNDLFPIPFIDNSYLVNGEIDPCCVLPPDPRIVNTTANTFVYSSMTQILSGATNGESLLSDLSVPIFLSQNAVDIGYYSVFDGAVTQKDTMMNFIFTGESASPFDIYFFNTSDVEFKKYLEFSNYYVDWGDGTPVQTITSFSPNYYQHTYSSPGNYTISMSGLSPWGYNAIVKDVTVPYIDVIATNPNGTAFFTPQGGSWSNTPLQYDFIFSGDAICENTLPCCQFTTIPFIITGYTKSSLNDLIQWGRKGDPTRIGDGKFKPNVLVTGASGSIGIVYTPNPSLPYTAYTVNDIDYYDYNDGTTIFIVSSSGCTDLECTGITKNEVLLNVVFDTEVYSNVFIERGKNSALERIQRLGEVNNVGDLVNYGYGFFNITSA
jgi:hypothetical protein